MILATTMDFLMLNVAVLHIYLEAEGQAPILIHLCKDIMMDLGLVYNKKDNRLPNNSNN